MSFEKVAENSKNLAKKYAREGNFGRAFSHYLVAFKLNPNWRTQHKEEFSTVLCKWSSILDKKKRFDDLFKCYEEAMEVFPDDTVILNNLGAHLLRWGLLKEAAHYFRKCLIIDPYFIRAAHNLENVSNLAVERWHFKMLNDQHRNESFREAIIKKIRQGFDRVLDVGTGTGILSLFSSEGKAKEIYACESSPIMTEIAKQVFYSNEAFDIKLINKHSSELQIPGDIRERVSLLVTETFDAGLLGEDILYTLSHAWEHLLLPPHFEATSCNPNKSGIVIPSGATLYATGVEFEAVANEFQLKPTGNFFQFEDCSVFRNCQNYDTQDLSHAQFRCLTGTEKILEINFNNPYAIAEILKGWHRELTLNCKSSGQLHCFAIWFDLYLDEDIVLSNNPLLKANAAWDQAIFPLCRSVSVKEGQDVRITVAFENRKLKVSCSDDNISGQNFEASESIIKTLNNEKLAKILREVVNKLANTFRGPVSILDCYPFPVFGLNFLIDRRNKFKDKLICFATTENDLHLIKFLAEKYGVEIDVMLTPEIDFEECLEGENFDVILLDLVEITGEIKDGILLQMNYLKSLLKPDGVILPEHVGVMGQFIYSDWLAKVSKVINDSVTCGYKISDSINIYQVRQFIDLNLKHVENITCSENFELFNLIDFCETVIEMNVPRRSNADFANAMVYWFKIKIIEGCDEIFTNDVISYHQAAFIFSKVKLPEMIKFNVICNNGLFRLELFKSQVF